LIIGESLIGELLGGAGQAEVIVGLDQVRSQL
jgi:hypothetical protein